MTAPVCGTSKILLDWTEKTSVLVVASLAVSPITKGFNSSRISKTQNSRLSYASRRVGRKSACRHETFLILVVAVVRNVLLRSPFMNRAKN
jgi:hypothetical protein